MCGICNTLGNIFRFIIVGATCLAVSIEWIDRVLFFFLLGSCFWCTSRKEGGMPNSQLLFFGGGASDPGRMRAQSIQ